MKKKKITRPAVSIHTSWCLISQTQICTHTHWPFDAVPLAKPMEDIWAVNAAGKSTCYGKYSHNIFNLFKKGDYRQKWHHFLSDVITVSLHCMQQHATPDLIRVDGSNWITLKQMCCVGLQSAQSTEEGEEKAACSLMNHSD